MKSDQLQSRAFSRPVQNTAVGTAANSGGLADQSSSSNQRQKQIQKGEVVRGGREASQPSLTTGANTQGMMDGGKTISSSNVATISSHSQRHSGPIKQLQAKHRNLEAQLARLTHEVALQNREKDQAVAAAQQIRSTKNSKVGGNAPIGAPNNILMSPGGKKNTQLQNQQIGVSSGESGVQGLSQNRQGQHHIKQRMLSGKQQSTVVTASSAGAGLSGNKRFVKKNSDFISKVHNVSTNNQIMSPIRQGSKNDRNAVYRHEKSQNYSGTRLGSTTGQGQSAAQQSHHSTSGGHLVTSSAPRSHQKSHLVDLMSHMKRGSHQITTNTTESQMPVDLKIGGTNALIQAGKVSGNQSHPQALIKTNSSRLMLQNQQNSSSQKNIQNLYCVNQTSGIGAQTQNQGFAGQIRQKHLLNDNNFDQNLLLSPQIQVEPQDLNASKVLYNKQQCFLANQNREHITNFVESQQNQPNLHHQIPQLSQNQHTYEALPHQLIQPGSTLSKSQIAFGDEIFPAQNEHLQLQDPYKNLLPQENPHHGIVSQESNNDLGSAFFQSPDQFRRLNQEALSNVPTTAFGNQQQTQNDMGSFQLQTEIVIENSGQDLNNGEKSHEVIKGLESGILNLHSHLKNLEGKYIDLANFYKQELLSKDGGLQVNLDASRYTQQHQKQMPSQKQITTAAPTTQSGALKNLNILGSHSNRPISSSHVTSATSIGQKKQSLSKRSTLSRGAGVDGSSSTNKVFKNGKNSISQRRPLTNSQTPVVHRDDNHTQQQSSLQSQVQMQLDQDQERLIIQQVKTQKAKLEDELRNLINLHSQITEESPDKNQQQLQQPLLLQEQSSQQFVQQLNQKSLLSTQHSGLASHQRGRVVKSNLVSSNLSQWHATLGQILRKHRQSLLADLKYEPSQLDQILETTFDSLYEELSQKLVLQQAQAQMSRIQPDQILLGGGQSQHNAFSFGQSKLVDLEKLASDYDIQQEYSLSSLKETIFQLRMGNDQMQLDIKKLGLDLASMQKRISEHLDEQFLAESGISKDLESFSDGMFSLNKRSNRAESNLNVLLETHQDSLTFLRTFNNETKQVIEQLKLTQSQANSGNVSGKRSNMSQGGHQMPIQKDQNNNFSIRSRSVTGVLAGVGDQDGQVGPEVKQIEITMLNQEVLSLRTQLADAKQNGLFDLSELRNSLKQLTSSNRHLESQIDQLNTDLKEKDQKLNQSERTKKDLQTQVLALQALSERNQVQDQNNLWRKNTQTLVDLSQKFLHSMRRLQKVVHRKEKNVQQEKQDFEFAKKDLEITIKEIKRQLESQTSSQDMTSLVAQPVHETQRVPQNRGSGIDLQPTSNNNTSQRASAPNNQGQLQQSSQMMSSLTSGGLSVRLPNSNTNAQETNQSSLEKLKDLEAQNAQLGRRLAKERGKVQNLLNDLRQSQEQVHKYRDEVASLDKIQNQQNDEQTEIAKLLTVVEDKNSNLKSAENRLQEAQNTIDNLQVALNEKQLGSFEINRKNSMVASQAESFEKFIWQLLNEDSLLGNLQKDQESKYQDQIRQLGRLATKLTNLINYSVNPLQVKLGQKKSMIEMQKEQIQALQGDQIVHQSILDGLQNDLQEKVKEISDLKKIIDEPVSKMQQLMDEIDEKNDHLQVLEEQRIKIEKQFVEKCEMFGKKEKENMELKENLVDLNQRVLLEESEKNQLCQQTNKLSSNIETLQAKINHLNTSLLKSNQKLEDEDSKYEALQKKMALLEEQQAIANLDIANYKEKIEELSHNLQRSTKEVTLLENQIKQLKSVINSSEQDSSNKLTHLQKENAQLEEQKQDLQESVNQKMIVCQNLQEQLSEKQNEYDEILSQRDNFEKSSKEGEEKINSFKEKLLAMQQELDQARQYIQSDQLARQKLNQTLEQSQKEFKDQINSLLKEKSTIESQNQTLREDYERQQDANSQIVQQMKEEIQTQKELSESKFQQHNEKSQKLFNSQLESLKVEVQSEKDRQMDLQEQAKKVRSDLIKERDEAQDQLAKFLDQTKCEKDSLEEKLQLQVSQTQKQLNQKEEDCQEALKKNLELQNSLHDSQQNLDKKSQLCAQMKNDISESQSQLDQLEKQKIEMQKTLESNKEIIQKLRDQLKKAMFSKQDAVKDLNLEIKSSKAEVEKLQESQKDFDQIQKEHQLKLNDIKELEKEVESKQDELEKSKAQFKEILAKSTSLQNELKDAKDSLQNQKISHLKQLEQIQVLSDTIAQKDLLIDQQKCDFEKQLAIEQDKVQKSDAMLSEAETLLEEFNNEKHEVKAKFKHLMQLVQLKASVDNEPTFEKAKSILEKSEKSDSKLKDGSDSYAPSSYKGREDEVDLNHCFEELEQIVLDFKDGRNSVIQELTIDKQALAATIEQQKKKLLQNENSLSALRETIESSTSQVAKNDEEMRNQLETAMRKIQNYKEELDRKRQAQGEQEHEIQRLNEEIAQGVKVIGQLQMQQVAKNPDSNLDEGKNIVPTPINDVSDLADSFLNLQKENMELLGKLQRAEQKLQKARNGDDDDSLDEVQVDMKSPSDDHSAPPKRQQQQQRIEMNEEVKSKFDQLNEQLNKFRKELQQAKENCVKVIENRFKKRFEESRRAFIQTELLDKKVQDGKMTGWNNQVRECREFKFQDHNWLLVQDLSSSSAENNSDFFVVNEASISETVRKYLRAFIAEYSDDEFIHDLISDDQNQNQLNEDPEIDKLKALVNDLKNDRLELAQDLDNFMKGIGGGLRGDTSRLAKLKDEEMRDDIEFLTSENKELQLKVKDVCLSNAKLKLVLAEVNQKARRELEAREMSSILQEGAQGILTLDGARQSQAHPHMVPAEDNLDQQLRVEHEQAAAADDEIGDSNLKLQEYVQAKDNVQRVNTAEDTFEEVKEDVGRENSHYVEAGDNLNGNDFLSDNSVQDVVNQIDGATGNNTQRQHLKDLEAQIEDYKNQVADLVNELKVAQEKITELHNNEEGDPENLIPHIKATLYQFLRNIPLSERSNEDLLTIIYNMMDFSVQEIQELKLIRISLRPGKNGGKLQRQNSKAASGGINTSSNLSMSREEEKGRKGLFGFLRKNLNAAAQDKNNGDSKNMSSQGGDATSNKASSLDLNLRPIQGRR